jgi:hypothetical protein
MANDDTQNVVSWQPHGKAFRVHQPDVFARTIMQRYFNQTKYKSFLRQLHLYGFCRIKKGKDMGGYYHRFFIQNEKSMILRMTREKIKGASVKNHGHEINDPDFYKDTVVVMDDRRPLFYNENRDFATSIVEPVPIFANFSGIATAKNNTYRGGCCSRLVSLLDFIGNDVASVVMKTEQFEDGDQAFFEGKHFYCVETSAPTPTRETIYRL